MSHQPTLAWMTAGICQTRSSLYPFHPNTRKVLSRANMSVTEKRMSHVFHPQPTIYEKRVAATSCLWKLQLGDNSSPLSRKTELRGFRQVTNRLVKQLWNKNWRACQLKRWKAGAGRTKEKWGEMWCYTLSAAIPCCIKEPTPNQKLLRRVKLFSTTSDPGLHGWASYHSYGLNLRKK